MAYPLKRAKSSVSGLGVIATKDIQLSFAEKVYQITGQIPKGRVATYRDIAYHLNCRAYRAVGNALNKNPYAPRVPCHRVIRSNGEIGGFASGSRKKIKILQQEGIIIKRNKIDLQQFGYKWS